MVMHGPLSIGDGSEDDHSEAAERRVTKLLPLLAAEPDLTPYVQLGCWFSCLLVTWQRTDEALEHWTEVADRAALRHVPCLSAEADRLGQALLTL
jgi:hypothetical protein